MFQWDALGHVPLTNTYTHPPQSARAVFDYFHLNSIDPQPDGDLLISSRNTWAAYLISTQTGEIDWQLGGGNTTFNLPAGVRFAWQHDAELLPGDILTVFDNEASPAEAKQSRVLDLALNPPRTPRASCAIDHLPRPGILSDSQGDVQLLSNGDAFVGWGQVGEVSEFSPCGTLTFDMHLAAPASTYRAFRYSGARSRRPAGARRGRLGAKSTQLFASWNGATDVASWRVLAGSTRTRARCRQLRRARL